ncbi:MULTISPECIES: glycosyltransferase [unclassified Vibrio]|uniref:glycosyltransferase n=2 Tax=Vibrio TaxID=662 RepID=UPI00354D9187
MNTIKYDVIVCTYNNVEFICSQLDSIMQQSMLPNKIIISDDSVDDSVINVVRQVANNYGAFDTEWLIVKGPQKGVLYNFISALVYSKSELLFFSDQDDLWYKDKVEIFVSKYRKCGANIPTLIYSDADIINEKGDHLYNSFIQRQRLNTKVVLDDSILLENCVQGASCCINGSLRLLSQEMAELIGENKIVMHDWFFAILARYFGRVYFIDSSLIGYRQHGKNQVGYISRFHWFINMVKSPLFLLCKAIKVLEQKNAIKCYFSSIGILKVDEMSFLHINPYKKSIYRLISLLRFGKK